MATFYPCWTSWLSGIHEENIAPSFGSLEVGLGRELLDGRPDQSCGKANNILPGPISLISERQIAFYTVKQVLKMTQIKICVINLQ